MSATAGPGSTSFGVCMHAIASILATCVSACIKAS
eukprot:CAMPEP_0206281042 /NCGR_PEP_ID=MMETSP0047_2-20121206/38918_1 /ASSEMBLY_ACC=CAM_ASM_000192 /TAXON_ID=195065 /ORGANISM="Chroomonas mesostigmatica_cf, Strain CCMP1168" /LENGTH=34 /DNA_ID= /DNA_START= /DNA_END= /DNA_ORIENTATION=